MNEQTGSSAKEREPRAAAEASAEVHEQTAKAAEQAAQFAAAQRARAADRAAGMAEALRNSAEVLRGREDWLADLVSRGAGQMDQFAATLRGQGLQGVLNQVGSFARAQPVLFAGATFAAGLAVSRVGRLASSKQAQKSAPRMSGDRFHA